MSSADLDLPVTITDKPRKWNFGRDAVTPGRLVAWGSEFGFAAALAAPLVDVPWEAGAIVGGVCTGAAVLYEKAHGSWFRVTATRAAAWLGMTGWASYALAEGPSLLTMCFGGVLWAAGGATNIGMDRWGENMREAEAELDKRLKDGEQIKKAQEGWAKLLHDICGIEDAVADPIVDKWRSGAGYTVKITLPAHLNVDALRGCEGALAGALHLPKGGGVSFNAGGPTTPRNVVFIAVTEKNMMSGAIPYPTLTPTTINKPVYFGVVGNGDFAGLNMKDEGFIAIGAQGSGKTGLMKTIGLGLVRCVDTICIDLDTSAKMSAAFVNPWLRHGVGAPLIQWPATTEDECRLAVRACRDAIAARKTEYADLLEDEDLDNLPARADLPAIVVRVDETKSMPDDVLDGLDFIIEEGRSVNVRVSNTGLRATRDYITAAMDELTPGRIGLRTNNSSELDMLYPGHGAPDMAIFTDPGTVVYMSSTKGPYQPSPSKVFATMPEAFEKGSEDFERAASLMMDAARQLSDIRPDMDPITAKAMGPAWSERWARIIPNLRGDSYGQVDASRMHESVWELYQSWPEPMSYDLLLGRLKDEDGETITPPSSGSSADIPRLSSSDMPDDDELDRLAAQEAAIELAKTPAKPKTDDELAVELFRSMGRPAKPSEVFPLMVKAGYEKKERTFRDLCSMLGLKDKLIKGDDGTYAAVDEGSTDDDGRGTPGPEGVHYDADGGSNGTDG